MAIFRDMIVRFDGNCQRCVHEKLGPDEEPCAECLAHPTRKFSRLPVNFEERKGGPYA